MDAKLPLASAPSAPPSSARRRRVFHWTALTALGALAFTYRHAFNAPVQIPRTAVGRCAALNEDPTRIWDKIVPSHNLTWTPCYGSKECAKLAVPLDYADASGPQAAIALLKTPSKVPRGQEGYRGPILFNPGGPGGSGVNYVLAFGQQLQKILGEDYDLIGFDPRGVGFTRPKVQLFFDPVEQASWNLRNENPAPLNSTPDALAREAARAEVFGDLAAQRFGHSGRYLSTALVARDMLRITEAHGEERLRYWGISYGTVLGATYAAMFPDKIERLLIDGVVDAEDYYAADWSNNLADTDAVLRMFYEACVEAGPDACALHESSADEVQHRTERIFAALKERPVAVLAPVNGTSGELEYGLVDYSITRHVVYAFLFNPYGFEWPVLTNASLLATALAAMEDRNGRPLWEIAQPMIAHFKCECGNNGARDLSGVETTLAIACSDGAAVDDSLEALQANYERTAKLSGYADQWTVHIYCSKWRIRAKERYSGPFVGNMSFPLMVIGNTADPVTPLRSARKMAAGFQDAVVLHQDSAGHCSISAASLCTAKAIRDYFRHGVLPKKGKKCPIESRMFSGPVQMVGLSEEDEKLRDASWELSRTFRPPMLLM